MGTKAFKALLLICRVQVGVLASLGIPPTKAEGWCVLALRLSGSYETSGSKW